MTLQKLIEKRDVKTLVKWLFGYDLTPMQCKIVRAIAWEEAEKITIKAYTQYGKTLSVALGINLHRILHTGDPIKYRLVASLNEKTAILRNYIAEQIFSCKIIRDTLDTDLSGLNRLRSEISRKRLTYKDSSNLSVHSAEGDAMRLMGHGGDKIVVDETGEIPKDIYNEKILRMTAGSKKPMIVEIGNPWDPSSHFAEHWDDPRKPEDGGWLKIHIPWQVGVAEGRITKEFIDERRRDLVPMKFKVLWDADFPEEMEDQLIKREWFESALKKNMSIAEKEIIAGLDVAEKGLDETVLINGFTDSKNVVVDNVHSWSKQETMQTVSRVKQKMHENAIVKVDATGVGSGVYSRLKELGVSAVEYKGGSKPTKVGEQEFRNALAEGYWQMRNMFEQGRIDLHKLSKFPRELMKLKVQLMQIRYEIQSDRLVRILKPDDKSPDYADALMLMCYDREVRMPFGFA